ncbi:MAG: DUF4136 domain-containing protein [Pseudomonadota bacterium]
MDTLAPARRTLFALVMLGLAACSSTPTATTDYDRSYDFANVHKIYIQPFDRTAVSNIMVSDLQVDRINAALTTELNRRGFQVVNEKPSADLYLVWHLVTEERTDVRSFNTVSGYSCWSCGYGVGTDISVQQYTQGTFIVDMVDPIGLKSVWRSIIQSRLSSRPDPEKSAQNRAAAAQAIFVQFPPSAAPQA